jgi:hypothetical protein
MRTLLALLVSLSSLEISAQNGIDIAAFAGYRIGGEVDVFYDGELGFLKIEDNVAYGIELTYHIAERNAIDIMWSRQTSQLNFYGFNSINIDDLGEIHTDYILISGLNYFNQGTAVTPFLGFGLGLAIGSPQDRRLDTEVSFAMTLQGGAEIELAEKIALKIRAALLAPLQFGSGGIYCGTGSGCNVGVGASTNILQGEFTGGIVVKL